MSKTQSPDAQGLVTVLIVGLLAGWLASMIVGGGSLVVYLISGVIGGYVGPAFLRLINGNVSLGPKIVTQIIVSAIGAIIVILLARLIF